MSDHARLPQWLKTNPTDLDTLSRMRRLTRSLELHTVCDSAQCPNRTECFRQNTATFLILGDICTRHCTFCAVRKGKPAAPDPQEPQNIVKAVNKLGLRYTVITSVTRDDLPDGGASQFAQTVSAIHEDDHGVLVEVLVPDFGGSLSALKTVIDSSPNVLNHNLETVPRLYPEVRPEADYRRSIELLKQAKRTDKRLVTKSGLMLGLGESRSEVIGVMTDLRQAGCDLLTIGQYLQPSPRHHPVVKYVTPQEFAEYRDIGGQLGFSHVVSAPMVRSSFQAAETYSLATGSKQTPRI